MRLNLNLKQWLANNEWERRTEIQFVAATSLMQQYYKPAMNHSLANDVLSALNGPSIKDFMVFFLSDSMCSDCASRIEFLAEWPVILDTFVNDPMLCGQTVEFSAGLFTRSLAAEIVELVHKHSGWHFSACNACAKQIEAFNIEDMALRLESQALLLWSYESLNLLSICFFTCVFYQF